MYVAGSGRSENVLTGLQIQKDKTSDLDGTNAPEQSSPRRSHSPEQWRTRRKIPLTNEKKIQIWSYHKENPLVTHADIAGK